MTANLASIYYNLSLTLDAGIPVLRALRTAVADLKGHLPKVFACLAESVSQGNPIAETMAGYPHIFAPLDILMVRAGEYSGNIGESFKLLFQWYSFCDSIKKIILSGLLLPVVILHIAAFVIPLPAMFLDGFNIPHYVSEVIQFLLPFYILAGIIIAARIFSPKQGPLRNLLDHLTLKIPLLGQALRHLALSRYCRVFHMLYKAGLPVTTCAQKAADSTGNTAITALLIGGYQSAKAGNPIYQGFSAKLPADFVNCWQNGEESGSLDNATKRLADNTAETARFLFTQLARWLPRLIYFAVSALLVIQILKNASVFTVGMP